LNPNTYRLSPAKNLAITGSMFTQTSSIMVRLENDSDFASSFIEESVRFCRPPSDHLPDFVLKVSDTDDSTGGVCYPWGVRWNRANRNTPLITIRIAKPWQGQFPRWLDSKLQEVVVVRGGRTSLEYRIKDSRGYLSYWLLSREECLIHILAHELRHLWQRDHKRGWVWGSKGRKSSERDADAFAIRKLREWRRKNLAKEIERAYHAASLLFSKILTTMIAMLGTIQRRIETKQ
jgi:hypothetical protein